MKFSETIVKILDNHGVKYEMDIIEGSSDMTECFKDGFKKPSYKYLLDFITHTKLERYPAIAQTCIDFLSSVAKGKPEQYKVPRVTAIIVCPNQ